MAKEKVNTFKLGLFVTVGMLLFIIAVYLIGNDQNLFQPTFHLNAVFQNAEGLKPGNNVRYAGIDAGTVKRIVIISDSTLRVEMALHRDMQDYIKQNAIASIGSDGLVGNKIINISPATSDEAAPLVKDQDFLQSYSRIATDDMLEVLGKTNENIALFSLQLLKISEKINKGSGTMNMLLQDPELAADLRQSVSNLKHTTQLLQGISGEMQQAVAGINEGDGLLHDLLYDTTIMADLQGLSGQLGAMMEERVDPILVDLSTSSDNMLAASTSMKAMLERIERGEGTVGSLLRDTGMEQDLKATLANIQESSERFKVNMEAMRHHFLFRGYFKKLEQQEKRSLKK